MSLTPDNKGEQRCPFPSLDNTFYSQFATGLSATSRGEASSNSLLSQETINNGNREFTKWNREIPLQGLAQYVEQRCKEGCISLDNLLRPGKVFIPTPDPSIPDELSYASPEARVQRNANLWFTHKEVYDYAGVLYRDPTILVAFVILQNILSDYIKEVSLAQTCSYRAHVFGSLEEHYRRALNFRVAIPISIYLASSPESRPSFGSMSLNSTTASQGLQRLQNLRLFSFCASDAHPTEVRPGDDKERVFTCPAEPFLVKVFKDTNALESVVSFIHKALRQEIIPKVILDEDVTSDSQPSTIVVPDAMEILNSYIARRVDLLRSYLYRYDAREWAGLAQNIIYKEQIDGLIRWARQRIHDGRIPPHESETSGKPL